MSTYDNASLLKFAKALNIQAITASSTVAGNSIDTKGFESLTFLYEVGARTDGTFTVLIQDSDDDSTFADVVDNFLIGTESAINTSNTIKKIGYVGKKRYVKLSFVASAVTSGATVSATAILSHSATNPVA